MERELKDRCRVRVLILRARTRSMSRLRKKKTTLVSFLRIYNFVLTVDLRLVGRWSTQMG